MDLSPYFFVDDVLFFSHGDQTSVIHIMNCIVKYSKLSGLKPSVQKSSSFFCNCSRKFTAWFDSTYYISHGELPVRFLGVPLISSQLCVNDCMGLVEKITARINSWTFLLLFC